MPRPRRLGIGPRRTIADAVEAATAGADRSANLVSISRLADMLARDRGTISEWIDKGCPVARKGGAGEGTLLDPAEVVRWRELRVREDEARKYTLPEGAPEAAGEPMSMADRKHLSTIRMNQQKLAMLAKILVHREVLQIAYARALGLVRQSVMSVPERIFREMAGFPDERVAEWRLQALGQCRAALEEGAKALNEAMLAMAEDPDDASSVSVDDEDA